jgi:hypothetical protein
VRYSPCRFALCHLPQLAVTASLCLLLLTAGCFHKRPQKALQINWVTGEGRLVVWQDDAWQPAPDPSLFGTFTATDFYERYIGPPPPSDWRETDNWILPGAIRDVVDHGTYYHDPPGAGLTAQAKPELIRRALQILQLSEDPDATCQYVYNVYRLNRRKAPGADLRNTPLDEAELPDVAEFLANYDPREDNYFLAVE